MYYHGFSYNDLENMLAWERVIYIDQIKETIRQEKEKREKRDESHL